MKPTGTVLRPLLLAPPREDSAQPPAATCVEPDVRSFVDGPSPKRAKLGSGRGFEAVLPPRSMVIPLKDPAELQHLRIRVADGDSLVLRRNPQVVAMSADAGEQNVTAYRQLHEVEHLLEAMTSVDGPPATLLLQVDGQGDDAGRTLQAFKVPSSNPAGSSPPPGPPASLVVLGHLNGDVEFVQVATPAVGVVTIRHASPAEVAGRDMAKLRKLALEEKAAIEAEVLAIRAAIPKSEGVLPIDYFHLIDGTNDSRDESQKWRLRSMAKASGLSRTTQTAIFARRSRSNPEVNVLMDWLRDEAPHLETSADKLNELLDRSADFHDFDRYALVVVGAAAGSNPREITEVSLHRAPDSPISGALREEFE